MGDAVNKLVHMHKVKRYNIDPWQMITFWDYDQNFHVVLRQSYKGADIHLTVEAQAGNRNEFRQLVIEAAIRLALTIKGMTAEVATSFIDTTGYEYND